MIPLIPIFAAVAIVRLLEHKPEKKKIVPKADDFLTGKNAALYAFNGDKRPGVDVPPLAPDVLPKPPTRPVVVVGGDVIPRDVISTYDVGANSTFLASIQQPIDKGIVIANIHRWNIYLGATGGILPYSFVRWEIDQGFPSPAIQFGECSQLPNPTPQQYFFGEPSAQGLAIRAVLKDGAGAFSTTPYLPLTLA